MFDKLVESTSTGAEAKPRRTIFAATFLFVAVLFATALVAGIYAANFDLGTENFDLAQLLTPIAETEPQPEPEPASEQNPRTATNSSNDLIRRVLMTSTDDPSLVPDKPSTIVNPYASTPREKWESVKIGPSDSGPVSASGPQGTNTSSGPQRQFENESEARASKELPPAAPTIKKPLTARSGGVMTGKAKFLPQPAYPAPARAVGAQGVVTVQITVDEAGNVISAKALDGNPLLRQAAVAAAWKAKFDPTKLSDIPVKVTGIITYNFKK